MLSADFVIYALLEESERLREAFGDSEPRIYNTADPGEEDGPSVSYSLSSDNSVPVKTGRPSESADCTVTVMTRDLEQKVELSEAVRAAVERRDGYETKGLVMRRSLFTGFDDSMTLDGYYRRDLYFELSI